METNLQVKRMGDLHCQLLCAISTLSIYKVDDNTKDLYKFILMHKRRRMPTLLYGDSRNLTVNFAHSSCTKLHYRHLDLAMHPAKMFSTVYLKVVEWSSYN